VAKKKTAVKVVKPKTTGFALSRELLEALDAMATTEGIKRSELVSRVLHEAVGLAYVRNPPGRRWPVKSAEIAVDDKGEDESPYGQCKSCGEANTASQKNRTYCKICKPFAGISDELDALEVGKPSPQVKKSLDKLRRK
jgi:hypothetical protein